MDTIENNGTSGINSNDKSFGDEKNDIATQPTKENTIETSPMKSNTHENTTVADQKLSINSSVTTDTNVVIGETNNVKSETPKSSETPAGAMQNNPAKNTKEENITESPSKRVLNKTVFQINPFESVEYLELCSFVLRFGESLGFAESFISLAILKNALVNPEAEMEFIPQLHIALLKPLERRKNTRLENWTQQLRLAIKDRPFYFQHVNDFDLYQLNNSGYTALNYPCRLCILMDLCLLQFDENLNFQKAIRYNSAGNSPNPFIEPPKKSRYVGASQFRDIPLGSDLEGRTIYLHFDPLGEFTVFCINVSHNDDNTETENVEVLANNLVQLEQLYAHLDLKFEDVDPIEIPASQEVCHVCKGEDNDEMVLLCDGCFPGCKVACHTFCLDPPMSEVPDDEWYCSNCKTIHGMKTLLHNLRTGIIPDLTRRQLMKQRMARRMASRQRTLDRMLGDTGTIIEESRQSRQRKARKIDYTMSEYDSLIVAGITQIEG